MFQFSIIITIITCNIGSITAAIADMLIVIMIKVIAETTIMEIMLVIMIVIIVMIIEKIMIVVSYDHSKDENSFDDHCDY